MLSVRPRQRARNTPAAVVNAAGAISLAAVSGRLHPHQSVRRYIVDPASVNQLCSTRSRSRYSPEIPPAAEKIPLFAEKIRLLEGLGNLRYSTAKSMTYRHCFALQQRRNHFFPAIFAAAGEINRPLAGVRPASCWRRSPRPGRPARCWSSSSACSGLLDVPHKQSRSGSKAPDVLAKRGLGLELPGRDIGHDFEGALLELGGDLQTS
jgi:hypothetical protein